MATCGECGREINDGAWVCGLCGAPVTDRGPSPDTSNYYEYAEASPVTGEYTSSQYVPGAPVLAASPNGRAGRAPRLIWVIALGGLVAVLAIVAVWFFVLRGPGPGVGFAGTWRGTTGGTTTEVVIAATGTGYELSMSNKDGKSIGPFATQMVDGNLTTSLEATAGSSDKQKAAAALFKQIMSSIYQNFTMVFTHRSSDDALVVSMQGVATAAAQQEVLHRVH
jgi:hypothetical protein